jgi:hypothetical protein
MRVTKTWVREQVARLQKQGWDIDVESAYNDLRICNRQQSQGYSGLTKPVQLEEFLKGFETGRKLMLERLIREFPEQMKPVIVKLNEKYPDRPVGGGYPPEILAFVELYRK